MSVPQQHSLYLPARLVKAKSAWYILFYQTHPTSQKKVRHRQKLGLNRIPDIKTRLSHALKLVDEINEKLPHGYPYKNPSNELTWTSIDKAMEKALSVKRMDKARKSKNTFRSITNIFLEFLSRDGKHKEAIGSYSYLDAMQFMDYLIEERGVGACTFNNYKTNLTSLFNELIRRNYLNENPFSKIKKRKITGKNRRAFNGREKTIIGNAIHRADKVLFLATLLQYYCFIRPGSEMRRLKIGHFNFEEGLIILPGTITKNKKSGQVTIPDVILPFIKSMVVKYPSNYLLFGKNCLPHPNISCGSGTLYRKHKRILSKLHKNGTLKDINGLTFYSWKDTGALELFRKKVNILEIMQQLRHSDLSTTQRYCQSLYLVNREIKGQDANLFFERDNLFDKI